jgi:hypothetical protein
MSFGTIALAALATIIAPAVADECACYVTDGSYPTYFSGYNFWDFRSLSDYANDAPDVLQTIDESRQANVTSSFFANDSDFGALWSTQSWDNGNDSFLYINSPNNVYIEHDSDEDGNRDDATRLTLRTARLDDFQTAAEIESTQTYDHLSVRMYARTVGSEGACTAMFTYLEGQTALDVQESDIEILTSGPTDYVQYTNQPSVDAQGDQIEESWRNASVATPWTDWAEHRIDWTPGRTTWSLDGKEVLSTTFQAPVDPAQVIFNAWSDGNEWSGLMPKGGEAFLQIRWIELVYNIADERSCDTLCKVGGDGGGSPGAPVQQTDWDPNSGVTSRRPRCVFPLAVFLVASLLLFS